MATTVKILNNSFSMVICLVKESKNDKILRILPVKFCEFASAPRPVTFGARSLT